MTYKEALDFLYTQLPMYQRIGPAAYKPGLETSLRLDVLTSHPHRNYPTIHVAGTNGKGSTAHTLAAVLRSAGLRTGLYTSPHLLDFRERIRVDGEMIPEHEVTEFVEWWLRTAPGETIRPSFFELTSAMAFRWFDKAVVDVAVIEVGLGGRLDSTNIITPALSVITNISFDHTAFLGDTLPKIAAEKAGIIKKGVPVVIGESDGEVREVFEMTAREKGAPILFADTLRPYKTAEYDGGQLLYRRTPWGDIHGELTGDCQKRNASTILVALAELKRMGWPITPDAVREGFARVTQLTGLMGRWMKLDDAPFTVCDTGHNSGGWELLAPQIARCPGHKHLVIGFVNDKDVSHILDLMPGDATYYFTRASVDRALPAEELARMAAAHGLRGSSYPDVASAVAAARRVASPDDTIFIGGSTFIVADALASVRR